MGDAKEESSRLLVIGAPRSGTRYFARWLRGLGLRVGHERMGLDACVSSYFVVDDFWYQGPHGRSGERRSGYRWGEVWHLVRDPLRTIPSIASMRHRSWWHWQSKHTGVDLCDEPQRVTAARFWVAWTERCLVDPEVTLRIPLERLWTFAPEILRHLELLPPERWPSVDRSESKALHAPLSLDELPDALATKIERLRSRAWEDLCPPSLTHFSAQSRVESSLGITV